MFDLIKRSKMKGTRDESALEFEMQFLALISSLAVRKVCMSTLGITYVCCDICMDVYYPYMCAYMTEGRLYGLKLSSHTYRYVGAAKA